MDGEVTENHTCDANFIFLEDKCISGNQATCQPDLDVICDEIFFAARAYPGDKSLFVGCIRSMYTVMQCFEDEYYDRDFNECVHSNTMERRSFKQMIDLM